MEWPSSESENHFAGADIARKIPEIPQKERFSPNFRVRNLKVQSPKECNLEPKVRLQEYGYNPFCSHGSRCLAVLVRQYFEEAFCAPKVRLKWYGFKGFPSHSSHCSGALFPQYSGVSPYHLRIIRVLKLHFQGDSNQSYHSYSFLVTLFF